VQKSGALFPISSPRGIVSIVSAAGRGGRTRWTVRAAETIEKFPRFRDRAEKATDVLSAPTGSLKRATRYGNGLNRGSAPRSRKRSSAIAWWQRSARVGQPVRIIQSPGIGRFAVSGAGEARLPTSPRRAVGLRRHAGQRSRRPQLPAQHRQTIAHVVGERRAALPRPKHVVAECEQEVGFFGKRRLRPPGVIDPSDRRHSRRHTRRPDWAPSLINNPPPPAARDATVVRPVSSPAASARVSASAFHDICRPSGALRRPGLSRDAAGNLRRATHVLAKVSRTEVAGPHGAAARRPLPSWPRRAA